MLIVTGQANYAFRRLEMRYLIFLVFLFSSVPASAQKTYTIQNWPDDVDKLPCDTWKREPDGFWTQVATIVVSSNGMKIGRNSFGLGERESAMVEKKCGVAATGSQ
jgi:hypothetical protein